MRKTYFIYEDEQVGKVLEETYDDLLAALKHRNPKAIQLSEDEEISSLHDLLSLLRLGHLKVRWANGDEGRMILLEVLNA